MFRKGAYSAQYLALSLPDRRISTADTTPAATHEMNSAGAPMVSYRLPPAAPASAEPA